jgi:hypothetical protein
MEGKIPSFLARIWNDTNISFKKKKKNEKNNILRATFDFDFVL